MHDFYNAYRWIFLLRVIFASVLVRRATGWPDATGKNWRIYLISGLPGVILGLLTFYNPFAAGAALIYLVAFWAMVAGLSELIITIRLRKVITGEGCCMTGGLLTI